MTASSDFQPRTAWTMTILLTGLALINFLDKVVIGLVAVPLTAEMHLSPERFGLIAGSFFWLFSISTIAVGFLSNRFPTRWLLLAMGFSWAVLQVPQAFTTSAVSLLACRVILGAAEGPSFPISVHALYKWFPDRKRNLPVAIVSQGAVIGLLMAGLLIPLISRQWGWRMNFVVLAVVGVIWSVLWLVFGREGTIGASDTGHAAPASFERAGSSPQRLPYRRILTDASVLSIFFLGFASYWMLGQTLTWLTTYLEKGLGFDDIVAGRCFAIVIAMATPFSLGFSWLSQRMLVRGASTRVARAQMACAALVTGGVLFLVLLAVPLPSFGKVLLFAVAGALPSVCFALAPALLAEVVPGRQRGSLVAIHTALASLGAAIGPAVMGRIVQGNGATNSHAYELGFAMGGVLLIAASLAATRWLHPERSRQMLSRAIAPATVDAPA